MHLHLSLIYLHYHYTLKYFCTIPTQNLNVLKTRLKGQKTTTNNIKVRLDDDGTENQIP